MSVGGCAVGPDYHRPSTEVPPAWEPQVPWHEATPSDTARIIEPTTKEKSLGPRARCPNTTWTVSTG